MDTKVAALRDIAALQALAPEWEALAADAVEPNPAYEPWMLLPAIEAFAPGLDLMVVTVHCMGVLAGLFPLLPARRFKGLPVRTLTSWRHPHCMLCVPLLGARYAAEALAALFGWAKRKAALLDFPYLSAEGRFHQALVDELNASGRGALTSEAYTRPLLLRERDADSYLAGAWPRDLRRKEKRLNEAGQLARVALRSREELPRWIEDFLALEAAGWKGRRGSALACTERNRRFARDLFTRAFEKGKLLMVGLDLDGRPIARYSAFASSGGAIAFKTAYAEDMGRFAPGILAEIDMIREFHARPGAQWMDSYTAPNNATLAALWKHRRTVQRVTAALSAWGELALAAAPMLRCARRALHGSAMLGPWRRPAPQPSSPPSSRSPSPAA